MISIYDVQARLRDAIKNSGLSQKELAGRLGIDPSTVSKYMRLDKFPSLDTFANLCEVLDISADDILGLKSSERGGARRLFRCLAGAGPCAFSRQGRIYASFNY